METQIRRAVAQADRMAVVRIAKALSDPVRLQVLELIAGGRACCDLPTEETVPNGVCVCELQQRLGLGQSLVSYHLRVLRKAGLVREEPRGRWTYYLLDAAGLEVLRHFAAALISINAPHP